MLHLMDSSTCRLESLNFGHRQLCLEAWSCSLAWEKYATTEGNFNGFNHPTFDALNTKESKHSKLVLKLQNTSLSDSRLPEHARGDLAKQLNDAEQSTH